MFSHSFLNFTIKMDWKKVNISRTNEIETNKHLMFRAFFYPRKVKMYANNVRASVTNSISGLIGDTRHVTSDTWNMTLNRPTGPLQSLSCDVQMLYVCVFVWFFALCFCGVFVRVCVFVCFCVIVCFCDFFILEMSLSFFCLCKPAYCA